jgi:hypothetical protein
MKKVSRKGAKPQSEEPTVGVALATVHRHLGAARDAIQRALAIRPHAGNLRALSVTIGLALDKARAEVKREEDERK